MNVSRTYDIDSYKLFVPPSGHTSNAACTTYVFTCAHQCVYTVIDKTKFEHNISLRMEEFSKFYLLPTN